jgi:hypothetical protein
MLGAGIFEATGKPVVPGSLIGVALSGGLDMGVLMGIDGLPRNRDRNQKVFEHRQALKERATAFANSEEARHIFSDVVRISLAE